MLKKDVEVSGSSGFGNPRLLALDGQLMALKLLNEITIVSVFLFRITKED